MTQLKLEDLGKAKELVAAIASVTPVLNMITTGYFQAEGYLDPDYERTDQLARLQMDVVNAINPIRDGMRVKDKARMLDATGVVRENLEKYGYRGIGELFRPHMTLARFTDGKEIDTAVLPDFKEFSGQFIKLGMFEMGDNGTCACKIAVFELGGKVLVQA
jgi:inorganic pyrophosphatase